jgi:ribonuclease E
MRTAASAGLSALRILEDEAARGRGERILLRAGKEAAVYLLNKKRAELADIEQRYGVMIEVVIDESFEGARMTVDSSGPRPVAAPRAPAAFVEEEEIEEEPIEDEAEGEDEEEGAEKREATTDGERQGRRRRRRRRGGRGRGRREGGEDLEAGEAIAIEASEEPTPEVEESVAEGSAEEPREVGRRRRRRRARGGSAAAREAMVEPDSSPMVERPIDDEPAIAETAPAEEPQPAPAKRSRRKKAAIAEAETAAPDSLPDEAPSAVTADLAAPAEKPARKRRSKKVEAAAEPDTAPAPEAVSVPAANNDTAEEPDGEPRRGWWQRTFG